MLDNEVLTFLKRVLLEQKESFTMYDNLHGEITINDSEDKIGGNSMVSLSTGSVYGIFAIKQENSKVEELFEEINKNVNAIDEQETIYPVYWGKDINPGSRIVIHARPNNSNIGNAKLEKFKALRNFKLVYGCVFVTKYKDFEQHLHKNYPPLIGTSKSGKGLKITIIDN